MNIDTDLDNLINDLENININEMPNNNPAQPINVAMLRLYVDMIQPYNGSPSNLTQFISSCEFLVSTYGQVNDVALKLYIIKVIQSKLVDRANLLVGSRTELNDWISLKNALIQCFGDKRSLECLEQDLLMAHPNRNEPPLEFAKRLQVLKSNLVQRINSLTVEEMDENTKLIHLRQYDTMSLRTLIRNLPGNLQQTIRLKNPTNIETAISYIIEEENFFNYQNNFRTNFNNQPKQNSAINQRISPSRNTTIPNNYTKFQNNMPFASQYPNVQMQPSFSRHSLQNVQSQNIANLQFPSTSNQQRFPSQPIPVQPRAVKQHFPTHSQVFGKQKDVFKPTGKIPDNNPIPMSTRTNYTFPKNQQVQNYRPNYFAPSGPPNFYFEELNHVEEDSAPSNSEIDEFYNLQENQSNQPNQYNCDNYFVPQINEGSDVIDSETRENQDENFHMASNQGNLT